MVSELSRLVQRGFHYTIVDEVDSVLIDEARTPHIISAPDTEPTKKYYEYARMIDRITSKIDYEIDEKHKTASLTEKGISKVEKLLGVDNLYEKDFDTVHYIEAALKEAIKSDVTTLLNFKVEEESNILPMLPPGGHVKDAFGGCMKIPGQFM